MTNSAILDPELEKELHRLIPNKSVKAFPIEYIEKLAREPEASREEIREQLIAKLDYYGLPPMQIDILVHQFVNGWSFRDIARHLGVPRSTVQYAFHKAIETLKLRGYK